MDLEVVGRHALLFDDDAMAAFTNSANALVEWNSLSIDRYDVRHLLPGPLPVRSRRRHHPDDALKSELDRERYLDLPSIPDEQDLENEAELPNNSGYHSVAFSYGDPHASVDHKNADAKYGFRPPFSVPEHLVQKLMLGAGMELLQGAIKPPTEKVHQIIARTALFVHTHGGQSEIVLRVKQGDNPTFGFLMPDHDLHPYFRFLVDNQELLKSDITSKSAEEDNNGRSSLEETGGALSLLGSVYGSGEDEEGASENTLSHGKTDLEKDVSPDKTTISVGLHKLDSSLIPAARDEEVIKHHISSLKDARKVIRRNHTINTVKAGAIPGLKEGGSSGCVSSTVDNVQNSSSSNLYKAELPIVEPPSDMKRVVDKIVEFILRNGKEFEAVLVQQDATHGRFPFLLPSNQYHLYYLKTLQKAQEPKLALKSCDTEKNVVGKESESLPLPSDVPYDSDKKEKFKMVIGKSKREGPPDTNSSAVSLAQPVGVSMDAAATAAILQAARKGITNPNMEIFAKNSRNSVSQGPSSEGGGEPSSFNSSRPPPTSTQKLVPLAKAIAKTAAIAAANEADSSEAGLTREQKLKAERLKRAKMFAAMIKGGAAAPLKMEPLHRAPSLEPTDSGLSRSGGTSAANNLVNDGEREESLVPMDVDSSGKVEKSDNTEQHADSSIDRRSKRSYRPRSRKDEGEGEGGEEEVTGDGEGHKHSRKKRRSRGSSHDHSRDTRKHKSRDSSHPKYDSFSDDEDRHSRHKRKEHISSDDEPDRKRRHSHRRRHKHDTSSDDEHRRPRHHHREHNGDSSGDDRKHPRRRHDKHMDFDDSCGHKRTSRRDKRVSNLGRDVEMEGEILAKSSDQSKASEARNSGSVELSKSDQNDVKASQPTEKPDDVPDDLRAKVRAMLMATL